LLGGPGREFNFPHIGIIITMWLGIMSIVYFYGVVEAKPNPFAGGPAKPSRAAEHDLGQWSGSGLIVQPGPSQRVGCGDTGLFRSCAFAVAIEAHHPLLLLFLAG